ncbi:MAG: YIP1 family protein [Natronospirillum sp.]
MILNHIWGLFTRPDQEWEAIRQEPNTVQRHFLTHTPFLAALPAIAAYWGVTRVGWSFGERGIIEALTPASALQLCVMFYLATLTGVFVLGKFIDFLSITYQDDDHTPRGVALATYTSIPLFLAGVSAAYPNLWFMMLVALAGLSYAVYLLYEGTPILMKIPEGRGFMFASSIVTIGLVMFVSLMAITVIFWSIGVGPEYTTLN